MNQLKITHQKDDRGSILRFSGLIDEEARFPDLEGELGERVLLDLEGVERINSCGVRDWIRWIGARPFSLKVEFEKCSPTFVEQANCVRGIIPGGAKIHSFHVPYFCGGCRELSRRLVDIPPGGGTVALPPEIPCEKCGGRAEVDVIEDDYLSFLKYIQR
jgi:hypothetical protein